MRISARPPTSARPPADQAWASTHQSSSSRTHHADLGLTRVAASGPNATPVDTMAHAPAGVSRAPGVGLGDWEGGLEAEALALLTAGRIDVWDVLSRRFEAKLIQTALTSTRGRRIEAAHKLGIGRNTITRKIQELHLE